MSTYEPDPHAEAQPDPDELWFSPIVPFNSWRDAPKPGTREQKSQLIRLLSECETTRPEKTRHLLKINDYTEDDMAAILVTLGKRPKLPVPMLQIGKVPPHPDDR